MDELIEAQVNILTFRPVLTGKIFFTCSHQSTFELGDKYYTIYQKLCISFFQMYLLIKPAFGFGF